jgi:RNA polymerase sigma-70 factor (ECF subfamily)
MKMMGHEPADDVRRARVEVLAERHRGTLVRYFRRKGLNAAAAEDCTQETFIRISRVEVSELDQPDAYLFQIASNVFLERARRARSRREDFHIPIDSVDLIDRESAPARIYEGKEALQRLAVILNELPQRTKEVFLLNRMDGLTYTQLATRFGVSVGTIEKQISGALAHLRARMDVDA